MLSIVLPIFNEEKNIPLVIAEIIEVMVQQKIKHEIICVNDGSRDDSESVLKNICKNNKNVKLVSFRRNFGQTAALMAGINFSKGDLIALMDADLQNDPADIPSMIEKLHEGFDVVSGWRKNRKDKSITRKIPSQIANFMIRKLSGVHIHDLGCTLKLYRADIIKQVRLIGEMHRFIPVHAHWVGARITEQVVNHRARKHGQANYGLERIVKVFLDMIFIRFYSGYSTKPIQFFGKIGLLSLLISFLSFIALLYHKIIIGTSFVQSPLLLLTAIMFVLFIVIILLGLITELLVRVHNEQRDYHGYIVKNTINFQNSSKKKNKQ